MKSVRGPGDEVGTALATWLALACLLFATYPSRAAEGVSPLVPPLLKVKAVKSLPREEAQKNPPARIEGVVTFFHPVWRLFFVEDDSGGIYCETFGLANLPAVGHRVRVDGYARGGLYQSVLKAQVMEDLGPALMPNPRLATRESLWKGENDGDYVRLRGVIVDAQFNGETPLLLTARTGTDAQPVALQIMGGRSADLVRLPGAEVEVDGVAALKVDAQNRVTSAALYIAHPQQLRTIVEARTLLTNVPPLTIGEWQGRPTRNGFVRIHGTVNLADTNEIYVTSGGRGVNIQIPLGTPFLRGDQVDLAAVPIGTAPELRLRLIQVLSREVGRPDAAIPLKTPQIFDWNRYGQVVEVTGEFLHRSPGPQGEWLVMRDGDLSYEVKIRYNCGDAMTRLRSGSRIRTAGTLRLQPSGIKERPLPRILVASAEDFQVVTPAPWPLHRTLAVVSGLSVALTLGLIALGLAHRRLHVSNRRVAIAERELRDLNGELEQRIRARTAELASSEGRYRALVEGTDVIVWEHNPGTGTCDYISPQAKRLGYDLAEWTRPSFWTEHLHPDDRAWATQFSDDEIRAGRNHRMQYRFLDAHGRTLWIDDIVTVGQHEDGTPAVRGVMTDITERKQSEDARARLEEQLRQSQKMEAIGTLAGGIAHDFNNILGAIIGYGELAMTLPGTSVETTECLDEMLKASRRARDLVRQILTFSRREEIERAAVPLAPIVSDTVRLLRATLPVTLEWRMVMTEPAPIAHGNRTLIQQILVNLATNAAQAIGSRPGQIEIELREVTLEGTEPGLRPSPAAGRYARLIVRDNGPGISEEHIERIFEPFFTTKGPGQGTGLGLSVVHGIVQSHGGTIRVVSEIGHGTSFEVYLPLASQESLATSTPAKGIPAPRGGTSGHILLIDDDPALLRIGERVLREAGHLVQAYRNPKEALEYFRIEPARFDLVITDYSMPGMTGTDLGKRIREIRPDIAMLISTGDGTGLTLEHAREIGFGHILHKPVEFPDLLRAVQTALAKSRTGSGTSSIQATPTQPGRPDTAVKVLAS